MTEPAFDRAEYEAREQRVRARMARQGIVGAAADVRVGDRATLWGGDGPDAEALAQAIGTVSYELLTRLMPRVEREYSG